MNQNDIVNLSSKCSRAVWEVCMADPKFNLDVCPIGANGLADLVLNLVLDNCKAKES